MPSANYQRPTSDFRKNLEPFLLEEYCESVASARLNYAAGTTFHQSSLSVIGECAHVQIELVAEPGNPHDNRAVALDINGKRCGYIHADTAAWYHDIVRAFARQGLAIFVPGQVALTKWGKQELLAMQWRRPHIDDLVDLATAAGLRDAHDRVVSLVSLKHRERLAEDCWTEYRDSLVRRLRKHADSAPELTWATGRRFSSAERVPIWHYSFVRDDVLDFRSRQKLVRRAGRIFRKNLKLLASEERVAARERARENREHRLAEASGFPRDVVLRQEGRIRRTPNGSQEKRNAKVRAERIARAELADSMARDNLSTMQIAMHFDIGLDTAKQLVVDGAFYRYPDGDPDRFARARSARSLLEAGSRPGRIKEALGLSTSGAASAIRDARIVGVVQQRSLKERVVDIVEGDVGV